MSAASSFTWSEHPLEQVFSSAISDEKQIFNNHNYDSFVLLPSFSSNEAFQAFKMYLFITTKNKLYAAEITKQQTGNCKIQFTRLDFKLSTKDALAHKIITTTANFDTKVFSILIHDGTSSMPIIVTYDTEKQMNQLKVKQVVPDGLDGSWNFESVQIPIYRWVACPVKQHVYAAICKARRPSAKWFEKNAEANPFWVIVNMSNYTITSLPKNVTTESSLFDQQASMCAFGDVIHVFSYLHTDLRFTVAKLDTKTFDWISNDSHTLKEHEAYLAEHLWKMNSLSPERSCKSVKLGKSHVLLFVSQLFYVYNITTSEIIKIEDDSLSSWRSEYLLPLNELALDMLMMESEFAQKSDALDESLTDATYLYLLSEDMQLFEIDISYLQVHFMATHEQKLESLLRLSRVVPLLKGDSIIETGAYSAEVHSFMLQARAPSIFKLAEQKRVTLKLSPVIGQALVYYIYTGSLPSSLTSEQKDVAIKSFEMYGIDVKCEAPLTNIENEVLERALFHIKALNFKTALKVVEDISGHSTFHFVKGLVMQYKQEFHLAYQEFKGACSMNMSNQAYVDARNAVLKKIGKELSEELRQDLLTTVDSPVGQDLSKLVNNSDLSDSKFIFREAGRVIHAHSPILCLFSNLLRELFEMQQSEVSEELVDEDEDEEGHSAAKKGLNLVLDDMLDEPDYDAFLFVIRYMYTGDKNFLAVLSQEEIARVMSAACFLQIVSLRHLCEQALIAFVERSLTSAIELVEFASTHGAKKLCELCYQSIIANMAEAVKHPSFEDLSGYIKSGLLPYILQLPQDESATTKATTPSSPQQPKKKKPGKSNNKYKKKMPTSTPKQESATPVVRIITTQKKVFDKASVAQMRSEYPFDIYCSGYAQGVYERTYNVETNTETQESSESLVQTKPRIQLIPATLGVPGAIWCHNVRPSQIGYVLRFTLRKKYGNSHKKTLNLKPFLRIVVDNPHNALDMFPSSLKQRYPSVLIDFANLEYLAQEKSAYTKFWYHTAKYHGIRPKISDLIRVQVSDGAIVTLVLLQYYVGYHITGKEKAMLVDSPDVDYDLFDEKSKNKLILGILGQNVIGSGADAYDIADLELIGLGSQPLSESKQDPSSAFTCTRCKQHIRLLDLHLNAVCRYHMHHFHGGYTCCGASNVDAPGCRSGNHKTS